MMITDFEIGDRVKLIDNDCMSAAVGVTGTVTGARERDHWLANTIVVEWDRDKGNQESLHGSVNGGYYPNRFEKIAPLTVEDFVRGDIVRFIPRSGPHKYSAQRGALAMVVRPQEYYDDLLNPLDKAKYLYVKWDLKSNKLAGSRGNGSYYAGDFEIVSSAPRSSDFEIGDLVKVVAGPAFLQRENEKALLQETRAVVVKLVDNTTIRLTDDGTNVEMNGFSFEGTRDLHVGSVRKLTAHEIRMTSNYGRAGASDLFSNWERALLHGDLRVGDRVQKIGTDHLMYEDQNGRNYLETEAVAGAVGIVREVTDAGHPSHHLDVEWETGGRSVIAPRCVRYVGDFTPPTVPTVLEDEDEVTPFSVFDMDGDEWIRQEDGMYVLTASHLKAIVSTLEDVIQDYGPVSDEPILAA